MLDRVSAVELIPAVIKHTVRPYMKEHHLNEDKMLFQYIGVNFIGFCPHISTVIKIHVIFFMKVTMKGHIKVMHIFTPFYLENGAR